MYFKCTISYFLLEQRDSVWLTSLHYWFWEFPYNMHSSHQVGPNQVQNETSQNSKIPLPCCRLGFPDSRYISFSNMHPILVSCSHSKFWKCKKCLKIFQYNIGFFSISCCSPCLPDSKYITFIDL